MLDSLERRLLLGACAVAILAFGYSAWRGRQIDHAQTQADQHHESAITNAAQGAVHDQQADAKQPQLDQDAAEVARLRAEVARLRRPAPPRPDAPAVPDPEPVGPPVDLAPLVAAQERLVDALTRENTALKAQVHTLTLARDSWRKSAGESAAEAVHLRAVIAAQQGLIAGALWKGRIQGLAVGAASGYIGGKL